MPWDLGKSEWLGRRNSARKRTVTFYLMAIAGPSCRRYVPSSEHVADKAIYPSICPQEKQEPVGDLIYSQEMAQFNNIDVSE
ncbi:hypothetical protein AVEN_108267-1 [Araneus ventricosus]|uniref:Uncharacterized protein n=1 Tax=Araneus ventricosus TaxID=182803 RepID=A0A4Y2DVB3_ARAVE|nr:hypothetical protein AVEN_108267-1 [Araneus ventricosus]